MSDTDPLIRALCLNVAAQYTDTVEQACALVVQALEPFVYGRVAGASGPARGQPSTPEEQEAKREERKARATQSAEARAEARRRRFTGEA